MALASKVAYLILADSHKVGPTGKVDAFGIFSWLNVWGFPATRECSITLGVTNVPAGDVELSLFLREPSRAIRDLGIAGFSSAQSTSFVSLAERLPLGLRKAGAHEVGVGIRGGSERAIRWVPLDVRLQPMRPMPMGDELSRLLADPRSVKSLRAEVQCAKCSARYLFEININPDAALSKGALPFPVNGQFACRKCNHAIHLRDLEGQLRSHIGSHMPGAVG